MDSVQEVIDFGGHLYSDRVPFRPDAFDRFEEVIPFLSDTDRMVEMYRDAGIDGTVVVAPEYCQFEPTHTTQANDVLNQIVSEYDAYIGGLACIPFVADGAAAAAEFERSLDMGFNGGVIETKNSEGMDLADERLEPVFDVAETYGAPIMVHPRTSNAMLPTHPEIEVFESAYRFDNIFAHQAGLWTSMCKVVHEGVLERHPDLVLIYDHIGANIASLMGRIAYQYQAGRWPERDNQRHKHWEEFKPQLEKLYIKMSGYHTYPAPLRAALDEFPSSHILFGTDFPFECRTVDELRSHVELVREHTSSTERNQILANNTRDVLIGL